MYIQQSTNFSRISDFLKRSGAPQFTQFPELARQSFGADTLQRDFVLSSPQELLRLVTEARTSRQSSNAPGQSLRPQPRPESLANKDIDNIKSTESESVRDTGMKDNKGRAIRLTSEAEKGLREVMAIAESKGIRVEVFSSYRSKSYQNTLFQRAIRKYGSAAKARKWVAPPGKSRHNYGKAIDLNMYRNGRKIPQREFDRIIAQAGMYRPMSYETWHIEPLSTRGNRG